MPIPNNGLITETNRQYYEGAMMEQIEALLLRLIPIWYMVIITRIIVDIT
jgi:hypothetical protein